MKWLVTLTKAIGYTVLAAIVLILLFPAISLIWFFTEAWIGEKTGWYRVEDYMCMSDDRKGCEEWIAEKARERKRERQNRPPSDPVPATKP